MHDHDSHIGDVCLRLGHLPVHTTQMRPESAQSELPGLKSRGVCSPHALADLTLYPVTH